MTDDITRDCKDLLFSLLITSYSTPENSGLAPADIAPALALLAPDVNMTFALRLPY